MNQIVIPKAIHPSPLQDQKLYQPSLNLPQHPAPPIYSQRPRSNHSIGAFKLCKPKKNKKENTPAPTQQQELPPGSSRPRHLFKLIPKFLTTNVISSDDLPVWGREGAPDYFDPNLAPLWADGSPLQLPIVLREANPAPFSLSCQESKLKIVQNRLPKIIQIVELPQEEELGLRQKYDCDPFIILKKTDSKKRKYTKKIENDVQSNETQDTDQKISKIATLHQLKSNNKSEVLGQKQLGRGADGVVRCSSIPEQLQIEVHLCRLQEQFGDCAMQSEQFSVLKRRIEFTC